MLLNLTYKELERVECDIKAYIKNKYRAKQDEIKQERKNEEDTKSPLNALNTSLIFLFIFYCSTHRNMEWQEIILGAAFILVVSCISYFFDGKNCHQSNSSDENVDLSDENIDLSDENIKREMLSRLKSQYFCESTINFLNMLYHKDILNKAGKERIDGFLASKGKGILDYLSSLGEKELEMFAKPYREQITIDIEQAVCGYYENKSKQEKSLLELVKA